MHPIHQTDTEEELKFFREPFPTPKGQTYQAHYTFFIPDGNRATVDKLFEALEAVDMKVYLFALDKGISIKAQFRRPMRFPEAESIILPILQRLDVPRFTICDGDLVVLDNHGELESFLSQDFLMDDDDDDDDDDEAL